MSVGYRNRRKWFKAQKRNSLRKQRAILQGQLNQAGPIAMAFVNLHKRSVFRRLWWALFKR